MALNAQAAVAVAMNSKIDAHTFGIVAGFAGRAGLHDGLDVLTRSKVRECGLVVRDRQ